MCLRTHLTMRLRERHPGNISGEHRSVLELAEAMRYELDLQDVDVSATREKQLNEQVNKNLKGGAISYSCSAAKPRTYSIRKGLGDWFRREKWWFSAISITSVACSTLWMSGTVAFWIWTFGLWIGQFWAFCICTTIGSRVLMIVLWCVAFVIIALPVTAVVAR
ncbi:hypothetical protein P154DRAFT_323396 [Amniculicola lignicola CBS 123094]|uniref:Uncharacterized protein n=1 Tax=Amniculicola lignicola CBS 123094 TaxID=1392246 RepID=A0A6A5W5R0_9PLEO|nr:hypothetical protein P154DRAFT_323396 [Amniculicola lignicola CBS 123094]